MRSFSVTAVDLLSFTNLDLGVPQGLSVIVGPNGSGKTNLGRVARMVVEAVRAAASGDMPSFEQDWSFAGRYGSLRFEARLGLEFDRDDERAIIEDWARAAVLSAFQLQNARASSRASAEAPRPERLAFLRDLGTVICR